MGGILAALWISLGLLPCGIRRELRAGGSLDDSLWSLVKLGLQLAKSLLLVLSAIVLVGWNRSLSVSVEGYEHVRDMY